MQNSTVMFTFSVSEWKYPVWANLVQKIKIISLSWNLVPTVIRICRVQWWCPLFLFLIRNTLFGQIWLKLKFRIYTYSNMMCTFFVRKCPVWDNLVQKLKIVSLRWNLIPRLIWICWIQWCCSVFSFSNENALLGQIWSKLSIFTV